MEIEIITKEDLQRFKQELIHDFIKVLNGSETLKKGDEYLKSSDVKKILKISSGTLQNLRINGTLKFSRIGGTIYYLRQDVDSLLTH